MILTEVVTALSEGQRVELQDWLLELAFITGTVGAASGLAHWAWRRALRPQLHEMVHGVVTDVVRKETAELRVNGGQSIKDSMGVLLAGQSEMRERMTGIEARLHNLEDR